MLWTIQIGETIADKVTGTPLPTIKVEEPTVRMSFSINTSPFVGREVCLSSMVTKNMLYHFLTWPSVSKSWEIHKMYPHYSI